MKFFRTGSINWNAGIRNKVLVLGLLFCSLVLNAQVPSLSVGNVGVCNSPSVLIPLTGTNLSNIGSMTLFIHFDDQSLAFSSVENIDPQLSGLFINQLTNPSRVALVWSNVNGAQFQDNLLMNLKFNVLQQAGNIDFAAGCEIANISLEIIPVNYVNGIVYSEQPIISSGPEDKTVKPQANALFQVTSPDASGYNWQESRNLGNTWLDVSEGPTYNGTHSSMLTVNKVTPQFSHYEYRCILDKQSCPVTTNKAVLLVDSLMGISNQDMIESLHFYNSPNPFSNGTKLSYNVPEQGDVSINLYTAMGKSLVQIVSGPHSQGEYSVEPNFVSLPAGIYFCMYVFKNSTKAYATQCKMIKIKND
jgi:hypothetical protein